MTLAIWLHTHCAMCCVQQLKAEGMRRRVKRVSCGRCCTGLCIKCQKLHRSAADLPGICNGWARSVKPLLLSLIHVTQDNLHRSWGATMGNTEKGGWSCGRMRRHRGRGDGGERGRLKPGCGQTDNVPAVTEADIQKDAIYRNVARKRHFESYTATINGLVTLLKPAHGPE